MNYSPPSVVYHEGNLWWCKAQNGPEAATAGIVEPGTNDNYWIEFIKFLGGVGDATPVGTIIMYYGTSAPAGYFACDGQNFSATDYPQLRTVLGAAKTPDLRGMFVRGYDTRNTVDPEGASRALGSAQVDGMLKITGQVSIVDDQAVSPAGTFYGGEISGYDCKSSFSGSAARYIMFDSSRMGDKYDTPEVRPKNIALLYCVKHD